MREISFYQAAILFSWFPLSFMLVVMMLIGRFYARFSGKRTGWAYLVIPIVLYALATVREARIGYPGDTFADILMGVAGVMVLFLVIRLYLWMMQTPANALTPLPPAPFLILLPIGLAFIGAIGPAAIAISLWVLGRFSRRMHHILQGRSYYYGYYVAAGLVALATLIRLPVVFNPDWALMYGGLMAMGCGIGAAMSWRAWSWLLAERE